jgi:hypothetical protein
LFFSCYNQKRDSSKQSKAKQASYKFNKCQSKRETKRQISCYKMFATQMHAWNH